MKKKTLIAVAALTIVAVIPAVATAFAGPSEVGPSSEYSTEDGTTPEWMNTMHDSMWNTEDGTPMEDLTPGATDLTNEMFGMMGGNG
jgi:hypothetical protein